MREVLKQWTALEEGRTLKLSTSRDVKQFLMYNCEECPSETQDLEDGFLLIK